MSSRHRLPLLLLVAFLPGNLTALLPPCLPSQSSALLELKSGFASHSLESWKRGTNCCSWDGVTCDATSGMVTALLLPNRSISGNLSTSLFNLTALEDLNLAYNLLDPSPLPPSGFERLANLTHLNLSNAGFAGQIPIGIAKLHNLVSLDLSTLLPNEVSSDSLKLHDPDLGTSSEAYPI